MNYPTRRGALTMLGGLGLFLKSGVVHAAPQVLVHKDPNCGCCSGWVRHLQAEGFLVDVHETRDFAPIRARFGVPADLAGCHVAEVGGYVIEGHVPAIAILRLLQENPDAIGLSVPGMPVGSPGMEGGTPARYAAILFGKNGRRTFMQFEGLKIIS